MVKRRWWIALVVAILGVWTLRGQATWSVGLTVQEALYPGSTTGIARSSEIVTVGVPLPDDATTGASSTSALTLTGATVGQFRSLGTWPSGRLKWVLVDTLATVSAGGTNTSIALTNGGTGNFGGSDLGTDNGTTLTIATGAATFTIKKANFDGIDQATIGGTNVLVSGSSQGFVILGPDPTAAYPGNVTCSPTTGGTACTTVYSSANDGSSTCSLEENGPVRAVALCTYDFNDGSGHVYMHGTARLHFTKGSTSVKVVSVVRNADAGSNDTFATAYKGHQGYELRLVPNITSTLNTYTIGNHTGTPTSGTMTGSDDVALYQGISTLMQYEDNVVTSYQITDSGYTIKKNGTTLQSGTSSQAPQGWCDIANGSGVGITVGHYQLAAYYPKGCEFASGGTLVKVGILPPQNSQPYYMEWPQWDELSDVWLNFHTSAPSSPANDFLRFQHRLVARVTSPAYYNTTAALPSQVMDPTTEDTYTTTVATAATPSITAGNQWAASNATRAGDFGTTDANWPLTIVRNFSWNLESDYRYAYLLNFLTRGMTGRYLMAEHFYRYQAQYMLAHSDGFDWRSGHGTPGGSERDGFGKPGRVTSANAGLGTHTTVGAIDADHSWRDQEHGFWYGETTYYFLSGDEFQKAAILDQQSDWYLAADSYQDGGSAGGNTLNTSGTAATRTGGSNWTTKLIGQVMLVGTSKTPYEVASVTDTSHLTFTTSAGTTTNQPFVVLNGMTNQRSLHNQITGGVRFAEFLRATGDTTDEASVLTILQHVYDEQVTAKGCASGYPAGCDPGPVEAGLTDSPQGVSRERGFHWGLSGTSGTWCGEAHTYRVSSTFQEALLAESLMELRDYRGSSWPNYYQAGDLAYGIAQWALTEGWKSGTAGSHAYNGFRFGESWDTRNDCQAASDEWTVNTSGTAVTRTAGPSFQTNGNWTSTYAVMADGTSAFILNGTPMLIASVTDGDHLTLQSSAGTQTGVTAYWREEDYDEPNANGALAMWPNYFVTAAVTGDRSWESKFKLSMQRSMAAAGLSFRDIIGDFIQRTMKVVTDAAPPALSNVTITSFTDNGGGSYTIGWTVPSGTSAYRIKWGPKAIVDWIGFDGDTNTFTGNPATTMNWFAATEATDPAPSTAGTTQTTTIATGTTSLTSANFSVKALIGGAAPANGHTVLRLRIKGDE